jgi:hypothetical protein
MMMMVMMQWKKEVRGVGDLGRVECVTGLVRVTRRVDRDSVLCDSMCQA